MLRLCTRVSHSQSPVELGRREEVPLREYQKDPRKYVMMPGNAKGRHVVVEERMKALAQYAEDCPFNRVEMKDTAVGVITAGICYQYVTEAMPQASVLKLGMVNPLPTKLIQEFAATVDTLYVVEELDGVIEQHCRAIGVQVIGKERFSLLGEFSQRTIAQAVGLPLPESVAYPEAVPVRPPVLCPGCPPSRPSSLSSTSWGSW